MNFFLLPVCIHLENYSEILTVESVQAKRSKKKIMSLRCLQKNRIRNQGAFIRSCMMSSKIQNYIHNEFSSLTSSKECLGVYVLDRMMESSLKDGWNLLFHDNLTVKSLRFYLHHGFNFSFLKGGLVTNRSCDGVFVLDW